MKVEANGPTDSSRAGGITGTHETLRNARDQARDFALALEPLAEEHDRLERFSGALFDLLEEHAVWGKVHGEAGTAPSLSAQCAWAEAIATTCTSTAILVQSQMTVAHTLVLAGSQVGLDLVDDMRKGTVTGWGLTEPDAGSDILSMRTTATPHGDEYVITGSKRFISNAGLAEHYLVFARTAPERSSRAISAFLVKADAPGLSIPRLERKLGLRASTTGDLSLVNVRVPATALVGELGAGVRLALDTLRWSRPLIGAVGLGVARGAYQALLAAIADNDGAISALSDNHQDRGHRLADLAIQISAARALLYDVALRSDESQTLPAVWEASASKTFCTDVAMRVASEALLLGGKAGIAPGAKLQRSFRDAKVTQIFEGTNQIQRNAIVKNLPTFS